MFKGTHVHQQHISKTKEGKTAERQKKDRRGELTTNELVESVFTYKPPRKSTLTESIAESDSHSSKSGEEV